MKSKSKYDRRFFEKSTTKGGDHSIDPILAVTFECACPHHQAGIQNAAPINLLVVERQ